VLVCYTSLIARLQVRRQHVFRLPAMLKMRAGNADGRFAAMFFATPIVHDKNGLAHAIISTPITTDDTPILVRLTPTVLFVFFSSHAQCPFYGIHTPHHSVKPR